MSRVQAEDYGEKRQAILDAGALLFARAGYPGARMEEIARACGASKSMLYHYFPRKEDVLFEIIREHAAGYLAALEEVVAGPGTPEERLRHFVVMWLSRASAARARHAVLMNDLKFLPLPSRKVIVAIERKMIARLGALIAEANPALARGSLPKTYALLLFGLLNWTEVWFRTSGPLQPGEMAERIHRLFLAGIAAERG